MYKNNTILQGLIALLITFILGYIGIVVLHNVFSNIINKLDTNVKNEYARYKIGEYILKEISSIETNYYKMGIVTKLKAIKPIQEEIADEIEDIKKAIHVLENGGVLNSYIKLNLLEVEEVTDKIYFNINHKSKYTFEAIDLIPKLDKLNKKVFEMEEIMKIRLSIPKNSESNISEEEIFKVKLFFKQLPTLFVRMKENASRLFYDSKKNLELLEKNIERERAYYKNLEYILTYFAMAFILVLGFLVIKQILKKSKELEDITKKAKESEEEALKANQTKSQFLANMSHEIRTPLNAIIGFSDILARSDLDKKEKEKASIISKSANALLNIINDILDISKIESGKFEISKSKFKLSELLEQIVQLYSVNTKQKNIRFLYNLDQEIPHFLISDETKLKQVLSNILSNAIKFTPENGKVLFNVNLKKLENDIATIRFSIKDEGIGISSEDQKKIFEPFSQADGSISRKFGGTGLGLAISLNIVKMLGSEIKLISKEKEGSTFYFELDLKVEDVNTMDQSKLKYDFAICSVIDDNEDMRNHLVNIVKYFGRIYEDDEEIEKCTKIDLIFCFGDPEFEGKLRRRKKHFNCPVVFVGNKAKIENRKSIKALMDYHLDVPIFGSKVFNIIAHAKSIEKDHQDINKEIELKKTYSGNVLVAEDNTNNQLLIKLMLEDLNLNITIVENGKLAFEEYQNKEFDLVFMDINMPVMDGIESLKSIREFEKESNRHTPIIALTANSIKGDRDRYLKEGMDHYLSKPIENNELQKILELYLTKGKENKELPTQDEIYSLSNSENLNIAVISAKLGVSDNIAQMVVDKFKTNIIKDMEEFSEIIKSENKEEILKKAHYIKNSCLNVSLDDICISLDTLEKENITQNKIEILFKDIEEKIKKLV